MVAVAAMAAMDWKQQITGTGASEGIADAIIAAGYDSPAVFKECIADQGALAALMKSALVGIGGITADNAGIHPTIAKLRRLLPAPEPAAAPKEAGEATRATKAPKMTDARQAELASKFEKEYPHAVWGSERVAPSKQCLEAVAELAEPGVAPRWVPWFLLTPLRRQPRRPW